MLRTLEINYNLWLSVYSDAPNLKRIFTDDWLPAFCHYFHHFRLSEPDRYALIAGSPATDAPCQDFSVMKSSILCLYKHDFFGETLVVKHSLTPHPKLNYRGLLQVQKIYRLHECAGRSKHRTGLTVQRNYPLDCQADWMAASSRAGECTYSIVSPYL